MTRSFERLGQHKSTPVISPRVGNRHGLVAPPIVHDVLQAPGAPLDHATRNRMESCFGHDFSRVRVHTGERPSRSARAVQANAYTVGQSIVFGEGQYEPRSSGGQQLLAHELAHTIQQGPDARVEAALQLAPSHSGAEQDARSASSRVMAGRQASVGASSGAALQRDETTAPAKDEEEARLKWPGAEKESPYILKLDPALQAEFAAMRYVDELLSAERIRASLTGFDFTPVITTTPPPWVTAPTIKPSPPLVPAKPGPEKAKPGKAGDVAKAILKIPSVDSAVSRLKTEATTQLRTGWRSLSTGERTLLVTQSALIVGGAIAGLSTDPQAGRAALSILQDRPLPIPKLPGLTFQFNVTGPAPNVSFTLDVGKFLPPSLGFGPKK